MEAVKEGGVVKYRWVVLLSHRRMMMPTRGAQLQRARAVDVNHRVVAGFKMLSHFPEDVDRPCVGQNVSVEPMSQRCNFDADGAGQKKGTDFERVQVLFVRRQKLLYVEPLFVRSSSVLSDRS